MNTSYINLLQKRIDGLSQKDFNLEVWNMGTSILLERIFGKDNSYSNEIETIKVDFSSWSLRDATADYNPRETAKRRGREILEIAMAELELAPEGNGSKEKIIELIDDKSGKLTKALAEGDEKEVLAIINKENKAKLAKLLATLLAD